MEVVSGTHTHTQVVCIHLEVINLSLTCTEIIIKWVSLLRLEKDDPEGETQKFISKKAFWVISFILLLLHFQIY